LSSVISSKGAFQRFLLEGRGLPADRDHGIHLLDGKRLRMDVPVKLARVIKCVLRPKTGSAEGPGTRIRAARDCCSRRLPSMS